MFWTLCFGHDGMYMWYVEVDEWTYLENENTNNRQSMEL